MSSSNNENHDAGAEKASSSATYPAGCHCGDIRLSITLSPALEDGHEVTQCNCSICRRTGYHLVYPTYDNVTWLDGSKERCGKYLFATKTRDHLFCKQCGCSIGIDFKELTTPKRYGISVRALDGIDLDTLKYEKLDGVNTVGPKGDMSGGR